jgi:hypothetical protein
MKPQTSSNLKLKVAPILLIAATIMQASSLYIFTIIDHIIHNDLYQHGLKFDSTWATPYWNISSQFFVALTTATILTATTTALIILYIKRNNPPHKLATIALTLTATTLNITSAYILTQIDHIIHHTLYDYGLQFSTDWATTYWTYTNSLFTLIGAASTITLITSLLIYLSTQKKIRTEEEPKTTKAKTKKPKHPTKLTASILIMAGTAALLTSILYASPILAFIGLGLLFWGILFTYIRTEEYAKKALLDATTHPQQTTLNQIIQELNYKGTPIYLPPKYFKNPETHKTYIPKQNNTPLPTPEQIQKQEQQIFAQKPAGMLLIPPGSELTKLFEKTLDTNFTRENLEYLQQKLPKLLIEDLEFIQNIEIETKNNKINVKIEHHTHQPTQNKQHPLTHPLSSAIACALARTTGKPITITKQETSKDNKTETIEYQIIDEEAPSKS